MARKTIATIAFLCCALSAAIHLATFAGIDVISHVTGLWLLHLGAFGSAISTFLSGNVGSKHSGGGVFEELAAWDAADAKVALKRIGNGQADAEAEALLVKRLRPRPIVILLIALSAYVPINFAASLALLDGGVPEQSNGIYRLVSHGKVLRQLTASEYRWARAEQTRLFTGHWMLFFALSGVFWLAPRGAIRRR